MKLQLIVLTVFVAFAVAAPTLPNTYQAEYTYEITTSNPKLPKITGKGTDAEDETKKVKGSCKTSDERNTTTRCSLKDYNSKMTYEYEKSGDTVSNCKPKAMTGNRTKYENEWIWLRFASDKGSQSFEYCGLSAETWEFNEREVDLKLGASGDSATVPEADDYKVSNSTGFIRIVRCFTPDKFFPSIKDSSLITIPPECKKARVEGTIVDNRGIPTRLLSYIDFL